MFTEYVFGYLDSGAILLVNYWFGGIATTSATFITVYLTMLNRPIAKLFMCYV
jgi:two-component system NarL family sensor kinase